jgi:hypothetical protein
MDLTILTIVIAIAAIIIINQLSTLIKINEQRRCNEETLLGVMGELFAHELYKPTADQTDCQSTTD